MGLTYLRKNGKEVSWSDITREERYFCAELFYHIKGHEVDFLNWLSSLHDCSQWHSLAEGRFDTKKKWEAAFEVCFFRDCLYVHGDKIREINKKLRRREKRFPEKRTFDLCLFAQDQIIIIEAKAHEEFKSRQIRHFEEDAKEIKQVLRRVGYKGRMPTILKFALVASNYLKKLTEKRKPILERFQVWFTWKDVFAKYGNPAFKRAEEVYVERKAQR